jgi:hypothetical protein
MPTLSTQREREPARTGAQRELGRYRDERGFMHTLITIAAARGATLVVDRRDLDLDTRLVARIEPGEAADASIDNAALIARHYLLDPCRGRPRALRLEDLKSLPPVPAPPQSPSVLPHEDGRSFRLQAVPARGTRELRWVIARGGRGSRCVSLRDVVGALEAYEPARSMTIAALARTERAPGLSRTALRAELRRLERSPTVLNRGLREALIEIVERRRLLTWSEVASRAGHRHGGHGDTSWVKRRAGLLSDGPRGRTPWVHHAVLAAIARRGLGIDPSSVEI